MMGHHLTRRTPIAVASGPTEDDRSWCVSHYDTARAGDSSRRLSGVREGDRPSGLPRGFLGADAAAQLIAAALGTSVGGQLLSKGAEG